MSSHLKEKRSAGRKAFRIFYGILVALSAVVVIAYAAHKILIRPPEVSTPSPSPQVSLDPESSVSPSPTPEPRVRKDDFYTFLIFGTDDGHANTDTILVASYDTANQKISVLSIPRDTLVDSDRNNKRINAVWAYEGIDGFKTEISEMLGIPIDFYVRVSLTAFKEIVDELGGIDFDVPQDMDYDDPTQDLYIHFKAGLQHLDGEDALKIARCRSVYANQDIGRIHTQQLLLQTMAKKALKIGNVTKVREFAAIFNKYVKTDLEIEHIIWFGEQFLSFDMDNLSLGTIPYSSVSAYYDGIYYVTLDIEKTAEVVNEQLNPYTTPITEEDLSIFTVVDGEGVHSDELYPG
ncbi:MAG TPA: LCP family protein [Oscillospiraceae bacterium]|nr:LCP family protein [Oscillospiraceae bacterium]